MDVVRNCIHFCLQTLAFGKNVSVSGAVRGHVRTGKKEIALVWPNLMSYCILWSWVRLVSFSRPLTAFRLSTNFLISVGRTPASRSEEGRSGIPESSSDTLSPLPPSTLLRRLTVIQGINLVTVFLLFRFCTATTNHVSYNTSLIRGALRG